MGDDLDHPTKGEESVRIRGRQKADVLQRLLWGSDMHMPEQIVRMCHEEVGAVATKHDSVLLAWPYSNPTLLERARFVKRRERQPLLRGTRRTCPAQNGKTGTQTDCTYQL